MWRFIQFLKIKARTLRVEILTIFLFLISLSSISIISFTYSRNSKSLLEFSERTIEQAGSGIIAQIDDLFQRIERVCANGISLIPNKKYFSFDELLTSYMLSVLKVHPEIYSMFYAMIDGEFFGILNLAGAQQTHFFSRPQEPLPPGSIFALRTFTPEDYIERRQYINAKGEVLATESFPEPVNPRTRSWFKNALSTDTVAWSPIHSFLPTNVQVITASKANFSPDGKPIAILGFDITLSNISQFLSKEKIGKNGKAYILDKAGNIIAPDKYPTEARVAFLKYKNQKKENFIFQSSGRRFLASVQEFSVVPQFDWYIVIIDPIDDFFGELFKIQDQVVLISIAILILSSLLVIYFSKRISGPIVTLAREADKIRQLDLKSELRIQSNIIEIKMMDTAISSLRHAMRSFGRYIPKEIVKQLIEKDQEITIGGEKKEVVIFFSDIEGFSSIAETYPADDLMPLLSEYLDDLSKIILEHRGNIDKFIGDGIMAIWGAPLENPSSASDASLTALYCQDCVAKLNAKFKSQNKPVFLTRIGIEIGEAIAGNVGTQERINYTVIGKAVNIASRLQGTNKLYHTRIIISEHFNEKISGQFLTRPLDITELRGQKEKIKIYELMAVLQGDEAIRATREEIELKEAFTEAFNRFHAGEVSRAKELFEEIHRKFPDDHPTEYYLERIKGPTQTGV